MGQRSLFLFLILFSVHQIDAQKMATNVTVRSCMFMQHDSAFVETSLLIAGNAVRYAEIKPRGFQATVEVQVIITNGSQVMNFDKYFLSTPVIFDTTNIDFSIVDQKRLLIPNQAGSVEVKITDQKDLSNSYSSTEALMPFEDNAVQISDIQFIESFKQTSKENNFTKNGFEMKPHPINFFPAAENMINFYGEIYNSDKYLPGKFLVNFSIRNASTDEINTHFFQYTKVESAPVVSFLRQIDISDLPSGNYNLFVEVRNPNNDLITQKRIFIQRANEGPVNAWENIQMINTSGTFVDQYTEEQLNYYLDILYPVATVSDARLIESLSERVEADMKRKFLYNFWLERNATDPYTEWLTYLEKVKKVNQNYGTPSRAGYKTDRGRVYLQYGEPYDIVKSVNEPSAYPYEIWYYTTLPDKQTNIGFAFYEPSMSTNDYVLLHSNARGELHDTRWKVKLYENVASDSEINDFDNTEVQDKIQMQRAVDMYKF